MSDKKQNPERNGLRAFSHIHAFLAGLATDYFTTIRVGSRIVGTVQKDVFVKRVKASRHFLRIPPAIAFDVGSLEQAKKAGARSVKVIDTETNEEYQALLSTIWNKGFELDRGHGRQRALSLSTFSKGDNPLVDQLRLWGG